MSFARLPHGNGHPSKFITDTLVVNDVLDASSATLTVNTINATTANVSGTTTTGTLAATTGNITTVNATTANVSGTTTTGTLAATTGNITTVNATTANVSGTTTTGTLAATTGNITTVNATTANVSGTTTTGTLAATTGNITTVNATTVNATNMSLPVAAASVGGGESVIANAAGFPIQFKSMVAGGGMLISPNATELLYASGAPGGTSVFATWNSVGNVANNRYLTQTGSNASESQAQMLIVRAGNLLNFGVSCSALPAGANTRTLTVRKNGVATILTVTFTSVSATFLLNGSNVAVVAGDLISVLVTFTGGGAGVIVRASIELSQP